MGASGCSLQDFDALAEGLTSPGGAAGQAESGGSGGVGGASESDGGESGQAGESFDGGLAGSNDPAGGAAGVGGVSGAGGGGGSEVGEPGNLFINPGFEDGPPAWVRLGNCTVSLSTTEPHSGAHCLVTSNRTQAWEGPSYDLTGRVTPGASYGVSVWVRAAVGSYPLSLTYSHRCPGDAEQTYTPLAGIAATTVWTELTGTLVVPECSNPSPSVLYVDGGPIGDDYCIDDTSLLLEAP